MADEANGIPASVERLVGFFWKVNGKQIRVDYDVFEDWGVLGISNPEDGYKIVPLNFDRKQHRKAEKAKQLVRESEAREGEVGVEAQPDDSTEQGRLQILINVALGQGDDSSDEEDISDDDMPRKHKDILTSPDSKLVNADLVVSSTIFHNRQSITLLTSLTNIHSRSSSPTKPHGTILTKKTKLQSANSSLIMFPKMKKVSRLKNGSSTIPTGNSPSVSFKPT